VEFRFGGFHLSGFVDGENRKSDKFEYELECGGDEVRGSARRWRAISGGPPEISSNPFLCPGGPGKVWNDGLGGPPKPAREPRALPDPLDSG
jgi:hypothetical protein